jgi:hypothetical protein
MTDNNWLLETIVAKSDQLNAVDLVGGPITVEVKSVKPTGDKDQPATIGIGDRQPYKPCKSMRRVLIACWGADPNVWIGRQMTLFCDPSVKWGGESVGGIRISHLSHLLTPIVEVQLNESKHRKITYKVYLLYVSVDERFKKAMAAIMDADSVESLERVWKQCGKIYEESDEAKRNELDSAKSEKMEAFKNAS